MAKFNAEIEVVLFGAEDVIATSGIQKTISLYNLGDDDRSNNRFVFGSYDMQSKEDDYSIIKSALAEYFDSKIYNVSPGTVRFDNGTRQQDLISLHQEKNNGDFDGTYIYNGAGTYRFTKQ